MDRERDGKRWKFSEMNIKKNKIKTDFLRKN